MKAKEYAKIGTQIYAVHKRYVDEKLNNSKIMVCKIRSYMNSDGKIVPIIREVGSKTDLNTSHYYIYNDLPKAINAITPKKS